jgi:hypothetical protein
MKRSPVTALSVERSRRSADADTTRPQRRFEIEADRPRRIDHCIDYFGAGADATRGDVTSAGSTGDDAC